VVKLYEVVITYSGVVRAENAAEAIRQVPRILRDAGTHGYDDVDIRETRPEHLDRSELLWGEHEGDMTVGQHIEAVSRGR
jgi:hypothetical protein